MLTQLVILIADLNLTTPMNLVGTVKSLDMQLKIVSNCVVKDKKRRPENPEIFSGRLPQNTLSGLSISKV